MIVEGHWHPPPEATTCRSCQASITWFRTVVNRKPIPIDVPYTIVGEQNEGGLRTTVLLGTTHFATCPHAALHRQVAAERRQRPARARPRDRTLF